MANPENLIGHGFDENPDRIGKGRPKGLKNRSTILREILALVDPDGTNKEYKINEAVILKAIGGDVSAYKEIQDTMYGKVPDKVLQAETTPEELHRDVTEEVLKDVPTEKLERLLQLKITENPASASLECDK